MRTSLFILKQIWLLTLLTLFAFFQVNRRVGIIPWVHSAIQLAHCKSPHPPKCIRRQACQHAYIKIQTIKTLPICAKLVLLEGRADYYITVYFLFEGAGIRWKTSSTKSVCKAYTKSCSCPRTCQYAPNKLRLFTVFINYTSFTCHRQIILGLKCSISNLSLEHLP